MTKLVQKIINPMKALTLNIDASMNGVALVLMKGGKSVKAWYMTESKKPKFKAPNVIPVFLDGKLKKENQERNYLHWKLINTILGGHKPDYIAIEDYAMGSSTHNAYSIGEMQYNYRLAAMIHGIPLRLYEPTKVKMFGTGNGSAQKSQMVVACITKWEKINFANFGKSGEDLADAYIIGQLLLTELKVQTGEIKLKDLPAKMQESFCKVSKHYPVPLKDRSFILPPKLGVIYDEDS